MSSQSAQRTLREEVAKSARSLFNRGLTHGSTGNIGVRVDGNILVTPTGSSMGEIEPDDLSLIDESGTHLDGPAPTKEAFLHAAMLRARPDDAAVVHTHSSYAAAVSCLDGLDPASALPPLTAYFVMRAGQVPLLPYHAPGDQSLGEVAEAAALNANVLLLRNHGPIASGKSLRAAMDAIEEVEETAKLFLLLQGHPTCPVTAADAARLRTSARS